MRSLNPSQSGEPDHGFFLSWSLPLGPLHRFICCVHSRSTEVLLRAGVSTRQLSFRPRGFAPPRRFTPHQGCGFVAPRCRSEVRRVSGRERPTIASSRSSVHRGTAERLPRDAVRTLRRVPLVSSRVASLRPLPSCRCCSTVGVAPSPTTVASGRRQRRSGGAADFRALLRRRVRFGKWPFPAVCRSFLPWALAPFKVLRSPLLPGRNPSRQSRRQAAGVKAGLRDGGETPPVGPRASLRGFPWCLLTEASCHQRIRAAEADLPCAFSALQQGPVSRPAVPTCEQATTDEPGPPKSVRKPKFASSRVRDAAGREGGTRGCRS